MLADNIKDSIPDIYSFITIREEPFGGFLFNPYLTGELSLDQGEYRVLELCNGCHTSGEIALILAEDLMLEQSTADTLVTNTLGKFNGNYAIHWRPERKASKDAPGPYNQPLRTETNQYIDHYSAPLSVIFELTHACNLKCEHCLVSAGNAENHELNTEEVKGVLDQLRQMKVFSVNFGGGEPLLRPDIIEILTYASELNLGIIISTNGLLVNAAFLDKLEDLKTFTVQVSVDGLEQTHDTFRGVKGSFRKALEALRAFSDRGYQTTMSTMILKKNIEQMRSLMELCIEHGIGTFKLSSYMPAGRAVDSSDEHMLSRGELKEFSTHISELKEEFTGKLFVDDKATYSFSVNNDYCGNNNDFVQNGYRIGCSAARSSLVISPEGEVYACPFFLSRSAGNLRNTRLSEMWKNAEIFKTFRNMHSDDLNGKCKDCDHIPYNCQGGCRAAAYLATGDFYGEDPFCWYAE